MKPMKHLFAALLACTVVLCLSLPSMAEDQPHMQAALEALRQAEKQLSESSHDKGGHRVRALQHVRQAIAEVERGMQFDNAHPDRDDRKKMDKKR
jgi:type VI protein secretion system component VasK